MENNNLIHNIRIIIENRVIESGWLSWSGAYITDFGDGPAPEITGEKIDGAGLTLLAGFIDVHVHGAYGFDTMDAEFSALEGMSKYFSEHGVTSFLATTWTDSHERIMDALLCVQDFMNSHSLSGARILGVHLEGPYLNAIQCGAQNLNYIRRVSESELSQFLATDIIKLISIAPEFEENKAVISALHLQGVTVSVAHSNANYSEMMDAIELGLSHSTHTFNAQSPLHHRDPGIVGTVINDARVNCELIADNVHVHPLIMNMLWQLKKPDKLILISDAVRATGLPDGNYTVDERVMLVRDGVVRLENGALAGSTLTMDRALYHFQEATQEPLENIWQVTSLNPAKAIGIDHERGSIEIGKYADLVLVDSELHPKLTVVEGNIVFRGN